MKGSPKRETPSTYESERVPRRKSIPHSFVLEAIADRAPTTRAMFGASAVYVGDKIVFILRHRAKDRATNGVWVAVLPEHEAALRMVFPSAGRVHIMGKDIQGWLLLSSDSDDFEAMSLRACELILARDQRIGKVPPRKR